MRRFAPRCRRQAYEWGRHHKPSSEGHDNGRRIPLPARYIRFSRLIACHSCVNGTLFRYIFAISFPLTASLIYLLFQPQFQRGCKRVVFLFRHLLDTRSAVDVNFDSEQIFRFLSFLINSPPVPSSPSERTTAVYRSSVGYAPYSNRSPLSQTPA